jgi:hypothetical protein
MVQKMPRKKKTETAEPVEAYTLSLEINGETTEATAPSIEQALEDIMKPFHEGFTICSHATFTLTQGELKAQLLMYPRQFRPLIVNHDAREILAFNLTNALHE